MARIKKGSADFAKAIKRLAAMKSIDEKLDLGNGLTLAAYNSTIEKTKNTLDAYNKQLSLADGALNDLMADEEVLRDWNERMLTGIATRYGKDSSEYEKAGGTKKSDIKRKKATSATAVPKA